MSLAICRSWVQGRLMARLCVSVIVGVAVGGPGTVTANPVGLSATPDVTFSGVGTPDVTITSSALRGIVAAQGFDIAANETTSIVQAANAALLVRIGSLNPTSIDGQLNAMGTLVLMNPNGVLFGAGSQINVNGLIASSLNITDSNFLSGRYLFEGAATAGMVRNDGQITGGQQGVYLLAPNAMNAGAITSSGGHIALAAGTTAYLSDRADGRGFLVEVKAPAGEAINIGSLIAADGGQVSMIGRLVTQSGLVQANSIQKHAGKIKLVASEQAGLNAASRTVADGGEILVSGRIIEQQGELQSLGTPARSGRVELIANEQANVRSGSRIAVSGDGNLADGGTIAAMATNATTGTVTIENGATFDVSAGILGGSRGEVWLGGASVARPAAMAGLADSDVREIPRTRAVTESDLAVDSPRSYSNFYALDNLTVTIPPFNLASRAITPAMDGTPRSGTLRFLAGNDLLVDSTTIQNGQNGGTGAANGWDLVGTAKNDIVFNASTWSANAGGSILLDAGRDVKLVPDGGGGGLTTLRTFTGGDIVINAGRDLIAPFARQPFGQHVGIRLQGAGNLTIATGRDFLGGLMAGAPAGPGFLLSDGRADVSVGGNLGSVYAPGTLNPVGPANGYANFLLGSGTLDLATFQVEPGSQRAVKVNVGAGGNMYFGNAADAGAAEGFGRNAFDAVTVHPSSEIRLTSHAGDIVLNPLALALDHPLTAVLPPTFNAAAPNGNISIQSDLDFWPSTTGNLALTAGNSIQGTVGSSGFVATTIRLCRLLCPDIDIGPASQPALFSLATTSGDIKDLKVELVSRAVTRTVAISSGRHIANVFGTIAAPDGGSDPSVTIDAKGNIDFTGTLDADGNEIVDPTGSGFLFGGTGLVKLTAGGNLNLAKSFGLRYQVDPETSTTDADQGGLLDIAVGENLVMDKSRIITNNGANLFIHGMTARPPIDGTTAIATSAPLNGNPVYVVGGQVVRDVAGHPVVVGGKDTIVGKEVLVVNGTAALALDGKPVAIDQTASATVTAEDLVHGAAVLDRPLVQLPDGTILLVINGKTVFSPAPGGGPIEGRPSPNNGAVTLMVGGQPVSVVEPLGGTVNVGTASNTVADQTGILTVRGGSIDLKATKNIEINLSRVATLGGGNITLTSTTGDINTGNGSITDITQFPIQERNPDGVIVTTLFAVPGSGIFTFHPKDGDLPNISAFDPISPLERRVILHRFVGHDVSELEPLLPAAREAWENQYEQHVRQLFSGFRLGDIRLTAAHNVIVPPAGIRGKNVTINAGHNLELQGGVIRGITTVNVGGQLIGSLSAFQGVFTVNLGGIAGGSPGTTLGLGSISGSIGAVTTSSTVVASTSTVAMTSSKAADEAKTVNPVAESRVVSDRTGKKSRGLSTEGSLRIRDKVKIKIETKRENGS